MRRRILDGLVTSPVTIEPILEGSPLYIYIVECVTTTTTMYGRQSSVAYEHSPRSKRPNPTTQSSVYREQCALTSTSHTSHRTNLVGGHSKCSSVQTVRIFTSASRHGKWARGEGPHTYIYIYARTYTCTPQDDDDDDDSTRTYRVQHHSRFPWAGAASRLAA